MIIDVKEFPPGTQFFFDEDSEDYIAVNPSTGEPSGKKPTTATAPIPQPTTPAPAEPPGSRVLSATVKEGFRAVAGDLKLYSTGKVFPGKVEGWTAGDNAKESNDLYATVQAGAGYCAELVASNFNFDLPEGATITGIQVTVERSKV